MSTSESLLHSVLADRLITRMDGAEAGHCVRVDDVEDTLALDLADELERRLPDVAVNILRNSPSGQADIRPERAIELRNRKEHACLLLVPTGEGRAASSLDNSYLRLSMSEIFGEADAELLARVDDSNVLTRIKSLRRRNNRGTHEAWAHFLAALVADGDAANIGCHLWLIGLIPDFGEEPLSRLEQNRAAALAISRPSRPTATIDERLTAAGLRTGSWRAPLRDFLDNQGAALSNQRTWTRAIAKDFPQLSFDAWPMAETIEEELEKLEVEPFTKDDGTAVKTSKLKLGADGQLILEVPEDGKAPLGVTWRTDPPKVAAVARWQVEVLRPADQRKDDEEPIGAALVSGKNRRATVRVSVDADNLEDGTQFVVVVRALGPNDEAVSLTNGDPAEAESQEFQVVLGEATEAKTRRTAAPSLPEAVLRCAFEGLDDLSEDLVSWDLPGQVFGLRLGNRRSVQVRVNELIVRLQHQATNEPSVARCYLARGEYGTPLDLERLVDEELELPNAVRKARNDFLKALLAGSPRHTVESAAWTDELRAAAERYASSYRRALDDAQDEVLDRLLRMDSISLSVRAHKLDVEAVALLPIHPLRLVWAAQHDEVLRSWAEKLTTVTPRAARPAMLNVDIVSQVIPANLPFATVHASGKTAIYAEELTFGSGLYLVPGSLDTDAAAEAVCSVLSVDRSGATSRSTSKLLAGRVSAYRRAHNPGPAMRMLAINPGSGDVLAGALEAANSREDREWPDELQRRRYEVVAYTHNASYVRPAPQLLAFQDGFRANHTLSFGSHLTPPLSFTVRPSTSLLTDSQAAHLALMQEPGVVGIGYAAASERRPSFRDLLVPLVTRSTSVEGELVWSTVPSTGGGNESVITQTHRAHQRAIGRYAGMADQVPSVLVSLDDEAQAQIRSAHRRADWVIGLDRFVGVNLFEVGLADPYVLDYAPDFVEGIGDRLTVTTTHREEVEYLLRGAMGELGLEAVDSSVGNVLQTLATVSGRLALRLLENSTQAREAVSLAALMGHLRERGELENTIVVPVDAHPEIFGAAARDEGNARRCDLLLVRVGQRSFKIECVEVKSRKEANVARALAEEIVEQLTVSKHVLESRFFSEPPRIDAELQSARLNSLLHYYADRSANHGLIDAERLSDIHRFIDRIEQGRERAEITMSGYVISLNGAQGFDKKYGEVPMRVLTADDLGKIGYTTLLHRRNPEREELGTPSTDRATLPEPTPQTSAVKSPTPPAPADQPDAPFAAVEPVAPEATNTATQHVEPAEPGEPQAPGPEASETDASQTEVDEDRSPAHDKAANAHPEFVDQIQGRPGEAEVTLGQDSGGSAVTWRVSTKGSPHAFVIGIPGQGKSVTTRKIIRDFADEGLPSLVFDFHGDMAADPPADATVLDAMEGLPFSPFDPDTRTNRAINNTAWEISEIIAYVAKLGEIQRNNVFNALKKVYGDRGWKGTTRGSSLPQLEEFALALEEVESGTGGKNARARLTTFTDFGLFQENAEGGFELLTDPPHGWVIDVSQLMEEVQRFAASFILRRVYREMFSWPQDGTMKLTVVLDEAHRMAKDVTLPKIMKEGRKYGVGVVVASQSADDFHKDVIGNAGTKIVFRTNFPASKEIAKILRGRNGIDLSQSIEGLGVGVAYVSTPDAPSARKVYMSQ